MTTAEISYNITDGTRPATIAATTPLAAARKYLKAHAVSASRWAGHTGVLVARRGAASAQVYRVAFRADGAHRLLSDQNRETP